MESGNFKDNCQLTSRLLLCFFWSCVSKFNGKSLFPLSMPYSRWVTTLQYREIFWQNGSLLYGSDTAKQEFFMRLQLRLQSLHKHDFISNQLLFYCWLTQRSHFNCSVSFSFNVGSKWELVSPICKLLTPDEISSADGFWHHEILGEFYISTPCG